MIDTMREHMVKVKEANRYLPNRPAAKTVWRWATKPLRDGRQLESVLIGGVRYTSIEALQRFQHHCGPVVPTQQERRLRKRLRLQDIARANQELDAAGVR